MTLHTLAPSGGPFFAGLGACGTALSIGPSHAGSARARAAHARAGLLYRAICRTNLQVCAFWPDV